MLSLPSLSPWLQQLAGNLPLLSLIEFIDMRSKLHVLELSGSISLWNWPITPLGGRLLLSERDKIDTCYLDRAGCSAKLTCIDGRYGDEYHSASSATIGLCISRRTTDVMVTNDSSNVRVTGARKQKLDFIQILHQRPKDALPSRQSNMSLHGRIGRYAKQYAPKFWIVSVVGWACWTALTALCFVASLHLAAVYLLLMPFTGLLVNIALGGPPRQLLNNENCPYQRMVVAAENLNAIDWLAFHGESITVNSLLNRPLCRTGGRKPPAFIRFSLRMAILGQWITGLGSACLQDWNALLISFWIVFCACVSTYAYTPEESAQDWLQTNCGITVRKISADFSSRRSMLGALVYLNPDRNQVSPVSWIDPILAPCQDRADWEKALLSYIEEGGCTGEAKTEKEKYWWKYVVEGVEMGKKIEALLRSSLISMV